MYIHIPTTLMLIFLVFFYADIKELIFEYHNHCGVIVMLLQTKGKFFSKPNLISNLISYYMLFLKQSKLARQCSPKQHATPSSKPTKPIPTALCIGHKSVLSWYPYHKPKSTMLQITFVWMQERERKGDLIITHVKFYDKDIW